MTAPNDSESNGTGPQHIVVVGPDGAQLGSARVPSAEEAEAGQDVSNLVEQPAKVMRIGTMIKQLLEEVRAAPLADASRNRLREIHKASITELEDGLAPELRDELERLSLPFTDDSTPSDAELRIAQAQLVGCSTASRPRCSRSRWRPACSWSRCAVARCRRASAPRIRTRSTSGAAANTCSNDGPASSPEQLPPRRNTME